MNTNPDSGGRRRPARRPIGAVAPQTPTLAATPTPAQPFDLNTDPILQQIHAASARSVADAQATELAGRKQALTDFGYDPGLSGLYPDESTQQAARANPFSVLANLLYQHQQAGHALDEGYNKQNLFYSSTRAEGLADEQRNYQQQRASGISGLQNQLTGLADAVLAAKNGAAATDAQGLSDAFARYQPPAAAAQPVAPPAGGGGTPALPTFNPSQTNLPPKPTSLLATLADSRRRKIGGGLL
jgi:hypothetical protein